MAKKQRKTRKDRQTPLYPFSGDLLKTLGQTRIRELNSIGLLCLSVIIYIGNEKLLSFLHTQIERDPTIQQLIQDSRQNANDIKDLKGSR